MKTKKRKLAKKFRAPKFTGIKKNHSAIFIADSKSEESHLDNRFRILTSQGDWKYFYSSRGREMTIKQALKWYRRTPCWRNYYDDDVAQLWNMNDYDGNIRETYFLGYVKDTE